MVSALEPACLSAQVYIPPLPTNNTGACIALHTSRTLPLLHSCCPSSERVYAISTNDTTNGTANCEYIVCNLSGYEEFREAAACMGRSLIVEGNEDPDAAQADSKRACEFNRKGSSMAPEEINSAGFKQRATAIPLLLCMVLGFVFLGK